MYYPRYAIWAVGGSAKDKKRIMLARDALFHLCMALAKIDYDYIRAFPETPLLYGSGVKYFDDSHLDCWKGVCRTQEDDWQDVHTCIEKKYGDCEDLCCWRIAELWHRGIKAMPLPRLERSEGGQLWHILVLWPDGREEDPSAILGMKSGTMNSGGG